MSCIYIIIILSCVIIIKQIKVYTHWWAMAHLFLHIFFFHFGLFICQCTISLRLAVVVNFFVLYSSIRLMSRLGSLSLAATLFRALWRHIILCVPLIIGSSFALLTALIASFIKAEGILSLTLKTLPTAELL